MNNNYENNNNSKSRTNKNSRVEFAEDMNRATTSQSQIVVQILIALITQILTHLIQIQTADSLILNKKTRSEDLVFLVFF